MRYIDLDPTLCEPFKTEIVKHGWTLTHQDVGQTELIAYGYIMVWEKESDKVVMNFSDRQGVCRANLEVSVGAHDEIEQLVAAL